MTVPAGLTAPTGPSRSRAILICPVSALIEGAGVAALVDGEQIALFALPGPLGMEVHAIGNHDPIADAPVLSRGIVGDVDGEPVVASPLYKQHFSLTRGRCLEEEGVSVPVHRVLISDGYVYLIR